MFKDILYTHTLFYSFIKNKKTPTDMGIYILYYITARL